jgi:hypothetical protein
MAQGYLIKCAYIGQLQYVLPQAEVEPTALGVVDEQQRGKQLRLETVSAVKRP